MQYIEKKIHKINQEVKELKKDLTAVEVITSKNWNDIAHLKAIK